jgi:hypothetical protein
MERLERIRQARRGKKLTKAEIFKKFEELFSAHDDHEQKQVGPVCLLRSMQHAPIPMKLSKKKAQN